MGRSAGPFKRGLYTNVTESSRSSVCADKLFKVPRMSVMVPPSALPPFCSPFCVCCSFMRSPTSTKARNAKRFCDVCLIFSRWLTALPRGQQVRDVIVGKTKHKCGQEHLLMPTHYSTLLFAALPFWPSSLSLSSFTLGFVHPSSLSPPPSSCFGSADVSPTGFTWWTISNPKGDKRVLSGKWQNFAMVRLPNEAAELSGQWLRKKTPQSIWCVCVHLIESSRGPWETTKGGKS